MDLPFPASGFILFGPVVIILVSIGWFNAILTLPEKVPSGRMIPLFIGFYLAFVFFFLGEKENIGQFFKVFLPLIFIFSCLTVFAGIWEKAYLEGRGYSVFAKDQSVIKSLLLPTFRK